MKLYATTIKTWKECLRDWKILILVLAFSPFFVLLMKLFYGGEEAIYQVGVVNLDTGNYAKELSDTMINYMDDKDHHIFRLQSYNNENDIKTQVENKTIDIGILIPKNYTMSLKESKAQINLYGSTGNTNYMVAAIIASDIIVKQGMKVNHITIPTTIRETFSEKRQAKNEFEASVPGLISLAVLMILFTATACIVKENDKGTLIRLKLSRLGALNYLIGVSVVQAFLAILAIVLSYWTALGLGYRPAGSFFSVLVVGIVSSLSMVAISLIVASFLNTVFDVLTIGCFPFFILMFFSGCMFPLPKITLFQFGVHTIGITDFLSLTLTTDAINRILNCGATLMDVSFDLILLLFLTIMYFLIGVFLYQKRKLSKA